MERLTEWDEYGNADIIGVDSAELQGNLDFDEMNRVTEALNRLATYEDAGLTPEEVEELAQAKQSGRMTITPCGVGDTVWTNFAMSGWYFRDKDKPYSAKVVFVGLNGSEGMGGGLFHVVYGKRENMMSFLFSDIGKDVFFTREEAEKALEELTHV